MGRNHAESIQYQLFMLALCVYTLVALAAEVVLRPTGEIRLLLGYADTAVCAVFLLDFFLCLYRAPSRGGTCTPGAGWIWYQASPLLTSLAEGARRA